MLIVVTVLLVLAAAAFAILRTQEYSHARALASSAEGAHHHLLRRL